MDFLCRKYQHSPFDMMMHPNQPAQLRDDLIDLGLGDLNITTDADIIDMSMADAHCGYTHYTDLAGDPDLIRQILETTESRTGKRYKNENLLVTTSGTHALFLTLCALINSGEEVILPEPCFPPLKQMVEFVNGHVHFISCEEKNNFRPDIDALAEAMGPKTKCLILNSPNNPTGVIYSREVLDAIMETCRRKHIFILSDEVYASFDFTGEFASQLEVDPELTQSLIVKSFSKSFSMTGWRLGYAIGPENIITVMKEINEGVISSPPTISQRAGLYALRDKQYILDDLRDLVKRRLDFAYEEVQKTPNMSAKRSEGTIYLFISIKDTGLSSEQVQKIIEEQAHVFLYAGDRFGPSGEGYLRLAVSQPEELIQEAFYRIRQISIFNKRL